MRSAIKFYTSLLLEVPAAFRAAIDFYVFWAGIVFILLSVFSPELARHVSVDLPLRPQYAVYTFGFLLLYGILRANYLRFHRVELQRQAANKRIAELTGRPTLRVLEVKEHSIPGGTHFHYNLRFYNDGPGTANNVQVRLQAIEPRPSYSAFRGEFPYPLPDLNGYRGPRNIGEREEEPYQLARSWAGGLGRTTVAGLDGFIDLGSGRGIDDWKIALDEPCVLRLTLSYSDTIQHLSVALEPKDGRLNPRIVT